MGQKTHPTGFRLGIVQPWRSRWFATKDMPALLKEDELIRKYLKTRLGHAAIARIAGHRILPDFSWPRYVRVGANSPSLWPTIASLM